MMSQRNAPVIAAVALFAGLWTLAWPFTVDDAYIIARYALRLAEGRGYTYNDGVVSDGVTGPLWLAPLALAARLGVPPMAAAKWLGAGASFAALVLALRRAQSQALGRRTVWLLVMFAASSLPFVVWSIAGLESGLAALLATALGLTCSARPRPSGALAGCAIAALCWLRPELLPFCAAVWCTLLMRDRRAAVRAALLALVGLVAVVAFRLSLFGHPLPLSASAKPALLSHGLAYVRQALLSPHGLAIAGCSVVALRRGGAARALMLSIAVHACALVFAGGDWMPGRRLFAPLVPLLALTLAAGLAHWSLRRPYASVAVASLVLLASLHELVPELLQARRAGLLQRERVPQLARAVCGFAGPLALVDVGALGLACPEHTFVDLGGLTDPEVAYASGGHLDKRISARWLRERAPGLLVLHSRERPRIDSARRVRWFAGYPIERRVLAFAFVQQRYEVQQVFEYADDYFYVLLAPRR